MLKILTVLTFIFPAVASASEGCVPLELMQVLAKQKEGSIREATELETAFLAGAWIAMPGTPNDIPDGPAVVILLPKDAYAGFNIGGMICNQMHIGPTGLDHLVTIARPHGKPI